jgi:hypothetical protein
MKCCKLESCSSSPKLLGILKIQGNPREQLKAVLLAQPDIGTLVQETCIQMDPLLAGFSFRSQKWFKKLVEPVQFPVDIFPYRTRWIMFFFCLPSPKICTYLNLRNSKSMVDSL